MKPLIDQAFWSDPDIEGSKPGIKLTALWLITNSQTNLLGICGASEGRFLFETGLKAEALPSALEALPRAFVKVGGVIFVRNYVRHQFGSGEKLKRNNFFVALKSIFLGIKDEELKSIILKEYPEFEEALQRAYQGLTRPKDVKDRMDKEEGVKGKKPKGTVQELRDYAVSLDLPDSDGEHLFDKWEGNGWKNDGRPIRDWRATMRTWKGMKILPSQKSGSNGSHPPQLNSISDFEQA